MNFAWSLNPVVVSMKVCGVPTYYEHQQWKSCIRRIFGYFWRVLSLICLLINCFFHFFNFIEAMKIVFICDAEPYNKMSYEEAWKDFGSNVSPTFYSTRFYNWDSTSLYFSILFHWNLSQYMGMHSKNGRKNGSIKKILSQMQKTMPHISWN